MRRALLIAAVAALALPAAALAHASLKGSWPGSGQRLAAQPRQVRLHFGEPLAPAGFQLQVLSAHGKVVSGRPRLTTDATRVVVPVERLAPGGYTVRWRVVSADDGHITVGVFTFGYRAVPPLPSAAYGSRGAVFWDDLLRWLMLAGLAVVIGGLGFRLLVVGPAATPASERRFYRSTGLALGALLQLEVLAFLLRSNDALRLSPRTLLYADLTPFAAQTRFGQAFVFMTLGFGVVTAFLTLAWLLERAWLLWPAFVASVLIASGFPLSSHSAETPRAAWRPELADWIHLTAACLWLGGLVQLALVVWPAGDRELRRRAFLRFSSLAAWLIAAIVLAGLYLSIKRLPGLSSLWSDHYGRVLLLKLLLVGIALAWGAFHHLVVRPRLIAGGADPARIRRSLLAEGAAGLAVLAATAALVNAQPPPKAPTRESPSVASIGR